MGIYGSSVRSDDNRRRTVVIYNNVGLRVWTYPTACSQLTVDDRWYAPTFAMPSLRRRKDRAAGMQNGASTTTATTRKSRTSHLQIKCLRAEVFKQNHVLWLDRFRAAYSTTSVTIHSGTITTSTITTRSVAIWLASSFCRIITSRSFRPSTCKGNRHISDGFRSSYNSNHECNVIDIRHS